MLPLLMGLVLAHHLRFIVSYASLCCIYLFYVFYFFKEKMVLIDQKSDQKSAVIVVNPSDLAITSQFI